MESFATPYPVMFSDGDQEVDKGQVGVHSVLQFKRFQAQLSRLIGIPANQLSAVFVCRRSSEKRQKLPINENTNFNIILNQHNPSKEKDCYFLVSLKKSKKERKGSRRRNTEAENVDDDDSTSSRGDVSPASQRPSKETDDNFAYEVTSPNSVLDQVALDEPEKKGDGASEPEIPVAEVKVAAESVVPAESVKTTNQTRSESSLTPRQVVENLSPPVTRIGGQQLVSRGPGEHSKFGVIGSAKALEAISGGHTPVLPEIMNQARFKDPVQQQQTIGGKSMMQRVNGGVPVFPDGLNMRLLTGRIANNNNHSHNNNNNNNVNNGHASFQQGLPSVHSQLAAHFQEQQQQQHHHHHARFSFHHQQRLPRSTDGYGRGAEQFCPDCASYQERNIRPPPFHCCINDRITSGFNGPSPAGPIERPGKRQLKAVA